MQKTTKKTWQKPELIVVIRNTPEESVLQGCKNSTQHRGPGQRPCVANGNQCSTGGNS